MFEFVTGIVRRMGYIGIALLTLAENAFPPIPSEVIMPLAGFVSARDGLTFIGAVAAGTSGSLLGALGWYVLGRRIGEHAVRAWVTRHGRWLTLDCDDIDRAKRWFDRHGGLAVFVGRLVPGVRTFVSLPAGFAAQPLPVFLAYSTAGTLLWTLALTAAGRLLGSNYRAVSGVIEPATWVVTAALVIAYVVRVAKKKGRRGGSETEDEP